MKRPVYDIQLLFTRKSDKVDRISGNANSQVRIVLRMLHRVDKHLAIQHVYVHVKTSGSEKRVEHAAKIGYPIFANSSEALRHQRNRQRNPIRSFAVRNLRN